MTSRARSGRTHAAMPPLESPPMSLVPIRLAPGAELKRALEAAATEHADGSAYVVAGIGSLQSASLRFAGEAQDVELPGPLEILSLSGTLSPSGCHLHMSVSDAAGRVWGGHVGSGNVVRTTAEILLASLKGWVLGREFDTATGYDELAVRRED